MTAAESRIAKQGATVLEEGVDGVFRVSENAVTSSKNVSKNLKAPVIENKVPSKPNAVEKITTNIEITGSNGSSSGGSDFKRNNEPPVKDSGKTYILESQDANWNFKSEIPRTAVKNSEGNYILGKDNDLKLVNNNTSYLDLTTKGQGVISIQGATKNSFNSGLDKIDKTKIASVEKVRIGAKITSKNYSVLNIPKDLESVVDDIVKNGDSGGSKTENLINEIVKRDTHWEILDGKYHGDNGFDHVFRNKYTEEVWILESKQFSIPKRLPVGSTKVLKEAAGGNVQGSQDWVETILNDKLQSNNPIKKIIEEASNNGKLHIGVSGINKKDKNLIVVPVNVKN